MNNITVKLASKQPCPFDCGSSDAYSEYINVDGTKKGKCFSCGKHVTLSNNVGMGNFWPDPNANKYYTPWVFDNYFRYADKLLAWFYNDIYININTIYEYRLAMVDSKIYLPCYLDDRFLGYQIKNLDPAKPKYITCCNEPLIYYTKQYTDHCDILIITEDWFSAIACSSACVAGLAIAGSNFSRNSAVYKFINKIKPYKIYIWLDDDIAGHTGAVKIQKLLENTYDVKIIRSKDEPKHLTKQEIKDRL